MNNGQIGIAAIDLNRPGIEVSQFMDTSCYSYTLMKMLVWMPVDVSSSFTLIHIDTYSSRTFYNTFV